MKFRLPIMIITLLLIATLLSACSPDFIAPFLISDASGGDLTHPTIAIDPGGRKYIAGLNSDNRVVYYRTYLGPAESIKTMAVDASYDQDSPEIAVLDDGTAVLVWIEYLKATTQYAACYTMIPLSGIYINTCVRLDPGNTGSGFIRVVSRGNFAYIIYDRVEGDLTTLFYKQVAGGSAAGVVAAADKLEGYIAYPKMAIDSLGNLHVVWYYISLSYDDVLIYSSNAMIDEEGNMDQYWFLSIADLLRSSTEPAGISFYYEGTVETVVIAHIVKDPTYILEDRIYIHKCTAVGCTEKSVAMIPLPGYPDWSISDVNLVGSGSQYHVSFINDRTVWLYTGPAGGDATERTSNDNWKADLHMVMAEGFPVLGYIQTIGSSWTDVFVNPPVLGSKLVFRKQGCIIQSGRDMASNNSDAAGVWTACGHTWFSTNAYNTHLPLIVR